MEEKQFDFQVERPTGSYRRLARTVSQAGTGTSTGSTGRV
jgi:hypothetical protein